MYKVELSENETILKSKELKDYESAFNCLSGLLKYLGENRKIIVYEKKSSEWVKFGEWKLQN
ncbi:hypothetical protein [Cetobacterium sp.]|uniref:hypothetical protein n=1 Tax=Cetobacterium sp. TaxID=2071632 RepID=UPI00263822B6|nr:hypothetical protein [uncultured Cetobacterium sp.]